MSSVLPLTSPSFSSPALSGVHLGVRAGATPLRSFAELLKDLKNESTKSHPKQKADILDGAETTLPTADKGLSRMSSDPGQNEVCSPNLPESAPATKQSPAERLGQALKIVARHELSIATQVHSSNTKEIRTAKPSQCCSSRLRAHSPQESVRRNQNENAFDGSSTPQMQISPDQPGQTMPFARPKMGLSASQDVHFIVKAASGLESSGKVSIDIPSTDSQPPELSSKPIHPDDPGLRSINRRLACSDIQSARQENRESTIAPEVRSGAQQTGVPDIANLKTAAPHTTSSGDTSGLNAGQLTSHSKYRAMPTATSHQSDPRNLAESNSPVSPLNAIRDGVVSPDAVPFSQSQTNRETISLSAHGTPSIKQDAFAALDAEQVSPAIHWVHTSPQRAEAGFHDPMLGWIGVRAQADGTGLHASLVPASIEAAQTLSTHLGPLNAHLVNMQTSVHGVTIAAPEDLSSAKGPYGGGPGGQQEESRRETSEGRDSGRIATSQSSPSTLSSEKQAPSLTATNATYLSVFV